MLKRRPEGANQYMQELDVRVLPFSVQAALDAWWEERNAE